MRGSNIKKQMVSYCAVSRLLQLLFILHISSEPGGGAVDSVRSQGGRMVLNESCAGSAVVLYDRRHR